jgi:hypothetical protein
MPTLTEDIDLPGGVEPGSVRASLQLWGDGAPIAGYASSTTIAGRTTVDGPTWTIPDVVGNVAIEPAGTVYRVERTWSGLKTPLVDYISMPTTGGPYRVDELLTDPPDDLPEVVPSNELDRAQISSNVTGLACNGFNLVPVPGLVATVPDVAYPTELRAKLWMETTSGANLHLGTLIAPVGSNTIGQQIDGSMGFVGAVGTETSPYAWAILDPHSPGVYQAMAYAGGAATVTVIAGDSSKSRIQVVGL